MRLVLEVCIANSMLLRHAELMAAFLNEDYQEPQALTLMSIPSIDGENSFPGYVAQICKSIYGTKNGPRIFIDELQFHLNSKGYNPARAEPNICVRRSENSTITMAVATDDFTVATTHAHLYTKFLEGYHSRYDVKDLGEPGHMLGWTLIRETE